MKEIWVDIVDYEGLYQVSNLGRFKSLDKYIKTINNKNILLKSKLKIITINKNGNALISLRKNGISKTFTASRLVYKAFNPDFDFNNFNLIVLQKDGNKKNINISNLYIEDRSKIFKSFKKAVTCITTKKEFKSALEASKYYKCDASVITKCCKNKANSIGVLNDKTRLAWMYLDDYKKATKEEIELKLHNAKNKNLGNQRRVKCITTGKKFNNIGEAVEYYNCDRSGISQCCLGKQKTCGKLLDGTPLTWEYIND